MRATRGSSPSLIAAAASRAAAPHRWINDTEWRQNGSHLWVGYRAGQPLGTIEHYGHYWATDTDSAVYGYFTRFAEGAAALQAPLSARHLPLESIHRRRERMLIALGSVTVLLVFTLSGYGWLLLL